MEQQYQSSRKMIHDMRNHLQAIEALKEQDTVKGKEYIRDMRQMLETLALVRYTKNRMLNIILNEKAKEAEELGIAIDIRIGEINLGHIRDMDVTTIFANLLDNALEAAKGAYKEKRIQVRADVFHEFVVVRIRNTFLESPKSTGLPQENRKVDGRMHMGLGLDNVRHTLKKYGGGMMTEIIGNEYVVNITIPDECGQEHI